MKQKLLCVVGTRPNLVKAAPLMRELRRRPDQFDVRLIHTGQHYDPNLSGWLFRDLGLDPPDISLNIGSGSLSEQTAKIIAELEQVYLSEKPDRVICFGDVNSTLAAAIVAAQMGIRLAHVEAGLRSFDRSMPEEINRIVTDHLSDQLFVTEESGLQNLLREGISPEKIFFTGNIMIDSLLATLEIAKKSEILDKLRVQSRTYAVATMHRPSNVDSRDSLRTMLDTLRRVSDRIPVVFPCHPRTRQRIEDFELQDIVARERLTLIEPLGYVDFCRLTSDSRLVLTDSGGIQEETTFLHIPCITMRNNTERPVTVDVGTNLLTGTDPDRVISAVEEVLSGAARPGEVPKFWDGKTAVRIVDVLSAG